MIQSESAWLVKRSLGLVTTELQVSYPLLEDIVGFGQPILDRMVKSLELRLGFRRITPQG